jgi:hypothetical protein
MIDCDQFDLIPGITKTEKIVRRTRQSSARLNQPALWQS